MKLKATIGNASFEFEGEGSVVMLEAFRAWLCAVAGCCPPPSGGPAVRLGLVLADSDEGVRLMLLIPKGKKATLRLDPRDADNNPATLDGVPLWTSSNPSVALVEVAADGLSAVVRHGGTVGSAQVNVVGDARMGPEVVEISAVLDVQTGAGEAVTLTIQAGPLEDDTPVV